MKFSKAVSGLKSSAVREILKLTQGDSIVSFAGGLPSEESFPIGAIKEAMLRVLAQGSNSLQYGLTAGFTPLREKISERMSNKGMFVRAENILITTGSQQAIDLFTRVLIDPSQSILVENPTYLAALQIFNSYQANLVDVESDYNGMDLNDLEVKIIKYRPRFVYVTPTFANPTGKVWSIERRKGLIRICEKHGVIILEDDAYGEIKFSAFHDLPPSIYALDNENGGSNVVYTSTFSKIVAPALRTGWVFGPQLIIQQMTKAKEAADLHSSSFDQQVISELFNVFNLDNHIKSISLEYERRMNVMVNLLSESLPQLRWNQPRGGMFLWVELPTEITAADLLLHCINEGVAFVPGEGFYGTKPKNNTMRLNFTYTNVENIRVGVDRLSIAIGKYSLGYDNKKSTEP